MIVRQIVRIVLCCFLCAATAVQAFDPPTAASVAAAQKKFADDLARDGGPDADTILATLAKARYQQSVIDAISRPAEAKP